MPSREAFDFESVPEYVPDWPERSRLRTPPGTPIAQASVPHSSELSEGSAKSSDDVSSTSPTTSTPGEDPIEKEGVGVPQVGGGWRELESRRLGRIDLLVSLLTINSESGGPRGS